jgi:hypothetical protein
MPNHVTNKIEFYGDQENINKVLELIKGEEECIDFDKIIPMPKSLHLTSGGHQEQAIQYAILQKSYDEKIKIKDSLKKIRCDFYGSYFNKVLKYNYTNVALQECATEFEEKLKSGKRDVFDDIDYEGLGIKTFEDLGNAYINNILDYGYDTWYDWSCAKWGTKWNAYDTHFGEDNSIMEFDTAWSCPIPVLDKLAEICYKYNVSFSGKWADEDRGNNVGVFESDCDGDEYWFSYEYVENCSNEAYDIYVELQGESECMGKDENGNWVSYDCDTCPNKCY